MKALIRKFLPVLEWIKSLAPAAQSSYLRKAPNDLIKFLSNCALNLRIGVIELPPELFAQLKLQRKLIDKISRPKISLKQRRKYIAQKGAYNRIISPIIPTLIDYAK